MHVGTEKPGSRAEGGPGAGSTPHEVSADGRFLLRLLVQNSSFPDTPDSPRQLRQAACCRPYRFALHLASNLFPSKLLMYTQIRMGQKSCKMHPKAASRKLECGPAQPRTDADWPPRSTHSAHSTHKLGICIVAKSTARTVRPNLAHPAERGLLGLMRVSQRTR